jgi:YD repeat-containing protein
MRHTFLVSTGTTLTRQRFYDSFGNLWKTIDRNGREIVYEYDSLDNRTTETWSGDFNACHAAFGYNPLGQLLTATDYNADASLHSSIRGKKGPREEGEEGAGEEGGRRRRAKKGPSILLHELIDFASLLAVIGRWGVDSGDELREGDLR